MNVEIGCTAETLDQRNRAGVGVVVVKPAFLMRYVAGCLTPTTSLPHQIPASEPFHISASARSWHRRLCVPRWNEPNYL